MYPAGAKLFVDYAGNTMPVFNQITNEERPAHIFIAALGASNYTYAEARWSEGLPFQSPATHHRLADLHHR